MNRPDVRTGHKDRPSFADITSSDAARILEGWYPEEAVRGEQIRGVFGAFGRDPDGPIWWSGRNGQHRIAPSAINAVLGSPPSYNSFAQFHVLTTVARGGSRDHGIGRHPNFNPIEYVQYNLNDSDFLNWVAGTFGQGQVHSEDSRIVLAAIRSAQNVNDALDAFHVPQLAR